MNLQRYSLNPVLSPDAKNAWEKFACFNGSIIKKDNKYLLFYRAMGDETKVDQKKLRLSVVGKAESADGYHFVKRRLFFSPTQEWEKFGCEDPRVTKINDKYFIFYTALAHYPPDFNGIRVGLAISPDLETIEQKYLITPFNAKAMTLFPEKINNLYTVLLT